MWEKCGLRILSWTCRLLGMCGAPVILIPMMQPCLRRMWPRPRPRTSVGGVTLGLVARNMVAFGMMIGGSLVSPFIRKLSPMSLADSPRRSPRAFPI